MRSEDDDSDTDCGAPAAFIDPRSIEFDGTPHHYCNVHRVRDDLRLWGCPWARKLGTT